jgi:hypothetical protein
VETPEITWQSACQGGRRGFESLLPLTIPREIGSIRCKAVEPFSLARLLRVLQVAGRFEAGGRAGGRATKTNAAGFRVYREHHSMLVVRHRKNGSRLVIQRMPSRLLRGLLALTR